MRAALQAIITALGSVLMLGAAAIAGRYLVIRRRTGGEVLLAEAIPVYSAYWREQRLKHGELLYVAIGDSAAQGIGASRPWHSYVGVLAHFIRHKTDRTVRVVNLAQSGARVREALESQLPHLAKLKPDILTVSVGANDIIEFDAERFEREIRELFGALPRFAIVAEVPCFYFGEAERRVRIANDIIRRIAGEHHLAVAPLYGVTRVRTAARTALRDVAADFFHPNDRGYIVWASAFEPHLTGALRRMKSTDAVSSPALT